MLRISARPSTARFLGRPLLLVAALATTGALLRSWSCERLPIKSFGGANRVWSSTPWTPDCLTPTDRGGARAGAADDRSTDAGNDPELLLPT